MQYPNHPRADDRNSGEDANDAGHPTSVLPTMVDLDRLAADLDRVDETLAALDREVAGSETGGSPDLIIRPPG